MLDFVRKPELALFMLRFQMAIATFCLNAHMYHYLRNRISRMGWIIAAIVLLMPSAAAAQSQLELAPPTRIVPESPQQAPQPPSQNSETIPSNPILTQPSSPPPSVPNETQIPPPEAPPPSVEMAQPILPSIFRGCWQGEVDTLDAIERLPGAARLGTWTPKTYRICYQRYGNGPYQLTFTQTNVAPDERIISPNGSMRLLSSQGNTAMMLGSLHFDEYYPASVGFFGFGSPGTFPVDETTRLRCVVAPDGMHVWATVDGIRNGQPWFRAYWHALFQRAS